MDEVKELAALCYISEDKNGKEQRQYFRSFGDYGVHYSLTNNIKDAIIRNAEQWNHVVMAEYETHNTFRFTKIILVYVEAVEGRLEYKYSKTLRDGEDLLKKYIDRKKELEEKIKALELDFPMFDGECYLIKTRDDMAILAEYFPMDHSVQYKLTGHEDYLYEQCDYDDEKHEELIKEFRENFFIIGDICTEDKKVPVMLNRHRFVNGYGFEDYHCTAYTMSEVQMMIDRINKTWNEKIKNL